MSLSCVAPPYRCWIQHRQWHLLASAALCRSWEFVTFDGTHQIDLQFETETAVAVDGISEMAASPFLLQDVIRIPADVLEELTPEQICLAPTIATRTQARASSNTGEARVLEWCSFYCTFNTFVTSEFTCIPSHGLCRHSMETTVDIQSMDILWTLWISRIQEILGLCLSAAGDLRSKAQARWFGAAQCCTP